jgi:hypothetical protein
VGVVAGEAAVLIGVGCLVEIGGGPAVQAATHGIRSRKSTNFCVKYFI